MIFVQILKAKNAAIVTTVIISIGAGTVKELAGLTRTVSIAKMVSRIALLMDSVKRTADSKICLRNNLVMGRTVNKNVRPRLLFHKVVEIY